MHHRALIVAAVSTIAQAADDKASIPQQLAECRKTADARGWVIIGEISIPGHSRNYNWLDELVADCLEYGAIIKTIRSGDISLILVRDYDRLWRTDALRAQVMALCREHQVQVYSLNQPVEPLDPDKLKHATSDSAMILEAIGGVIAESENRTRVRRMKVGKEAVIRSGLSLYSNHVPYGYRKIIGSNLLEMIPTEAAWVRWIYERRATDRWGYKRTSTELNRQGVAAPMESASGWLDMTVRIIIANPIYKGATHWGDAYCEQGKHEAIVTPELWHTAQQVPPTCEHQKAISSRHGHLLLSGLCVCGYCGHAMTYTIPSPASRGLRCSYYEHSGGRMCTSNWNIAAKVEKCVFDTVCDILKNPDAFLKQQATKSESNDSADELAAIERELADLKARYARWDILYEQGGITSDELLGHRQRIHSRIDELKHQNDAITNTARADAARANTVNELSVVVGQLPNMQMDELKYFYRRLIRNVVLKRSEEPIINWL